MGKLIASIKKEFLLLTSDKIGLLLMYLMPVFLVFVITIVQDSTFKLVNENSIEILVVNNDQGTLGNDLIEILQQSGSFKITELERLRKEEIKQYLLNDSQLLAIDIPEKFTDEVTKKAEGISREMLEEFGLRYKCTRGARNFSSKHILRPYSSRKFQVIHCQFNLFLPRCIRKQVDD